MHTPLLFLRSKLLAIPNLSVKYRKRQRAFGFRTCVIVYAIFLINPWKEFILLFQRISSLIACCKFAFTKVVARWNVAFREFAGIILFINFRAVAFPNLNDGFFFNKFKIHFTSLNYYSMPVSILFIVRKRLNFAFTLLFLLGIVLFSLL